MGSAYSMKERDDLNANKIETAMNKYLLLVALIISVNIGVCQSQYKNGLFFELGGSAIVYSVNYERQLPKGALLRIGAEYVDNSIAIPVTFGKVFGKGSHHFEMNGGFFYANSHVTDPDGLTRRVNSLFATAFLGYRYQNPDKRFFFRAGPTFISFIADNDRYKDRRWYFMPWFGLSAGYRF